MRIKVTAADIRKAKREMDKSRSRHCPVAQSLKRQCPAHADTVLVGSTMVEMAGHRVLATDSIREFIDRVDRDLKVEPHTFNLPGLKC